MAKSLKAYQPLLGFFGFGFGYFSLPMFHWKCLMHGDFLLSFQRKRESNDFKYLWTSVMRKEGETYLFGSRVDTVKKEDIDLYLVLEKHDSLY